MIPIALAALSTSLHLSVRCADGPPASWVVLLVLSGLRLGYEVVVDLAKRWDR
jgi:hypothetical protein